MKIQLKRSSVLTAGAAKTPTASQLEHGELAVNFNTSDPAIFLKDSNNNVIRISGVGNISDDGLTNVPDGTTPPSNPEAGNLWYNSDQGRLYIYFEDADTSQWVDASPDSWDPSSYPDVTNTSAQSGTLDDRYAMVNGGNSFTAIVDSNKFFRSTRTASNNGELFFQGKVGSTTNCSIAADGSATFVGNVGIGGIQVTENITPTAGSGIEIFKPSSTSGQIQAFNRGSSAWMDLIIKGNTQQFHANGSERMRIDASGNVGVGTSSTTSISNYTTFTLNGATGGNLEFQDSGTLKGSLYNTASEFILQAQGSSTPLAFRTNASERMRIDSAGNVGINNASPSSYNSDGRNLVVGSGSGSQGLSIASGTSGYGNIYFADGTSGNTMFRGMLSYYHADDHMQFRTASVERMRIDSSGRVAIGTTSVADSATALVIKNSASGNDHTLLDIVCDTNETARVRFSEDGSNFPGEIKYDTNNHFLAFSANSAEGMRIDSSGNVGINVTSVNSTRKLEIKQPASYAAALRIFADGNGNDGVIQWFSGLSQYEIGITQGTDALKFNRDSSELMRMDSSGRVGIGATSFNDTRERLRIQSPSGSDTFVTIKAPSNSGESALFFGDSDFNRGAVSYEHSGDNMLFRVGDAERMRLTSGGTLLIGKTVSSANQNYVQIHNGSAASSAYLQSTNASTGTGHSDGLVLGMGDATNAYFWNYEAGSAIFAVGAAERSRINPQGYSLFAPDASYYGDHGTSAWHTFDQTTAQWTLGLRSRSSQPYGLIISFSAAAPNNSASTFIYAADSSNVRFLVKSNGGINNYQSNNSNLCDEREKKNIVSLDTKWDKVKSWELKKFHYNEDADTDDLRYGVIAQQVETNCPEVLTEWEKVAAKEAVLDEDGNVVTPAKEAVMRKGVKEQQMMWMAIKALQEAMTKIETLEAKVAALEAA